MSFPKQMIPLFISLFVLLACTVPSVAVATVAPAIFTPVVTLVPPTETASAPATDTPTPTRSPLGEPIAHLPAGQEIKITFIKMLGESQGWAIGGAYGTSDHIFRTTDGALTWQDITPPEPQPSKTAIGFFLDAQTAWVAFYAEAMAGTENASIWYTKDGGTSWQYTELTDPALHQTGYFPSDLSFVDAQHGWMMVHVGAGMNHDYFVLLATADGGVTWQTLITPQGDVAPTTQGCYKNALTFVSPQDGWMSVDCHGVAPVPYIFRSHDGGQSWENVPLPAPPTLPDIFKQGYCGPSDPILFTPTSGLLVLNCVQYDPNIKASFLYETTDDGASWQVYPYPGGPLQFVGPTTAFALSRNIQRSDDAGHTWAAVKPVNWDGQFSFINPQTAWVVATDNGQSALVRTDNGGLVWVEIKPKVAP